MTNAQLWGAVALVQAFQFFLPAGEIFNPIIHGVLKAMVWVESETLTEIAIYTQTTQLVEYIRNRPRFNGHLRITGQSLGGGISLITVSSSSVQLCLLALLSLRCKHSPSSSGSPNKHPCDRHFRYVLCNGSNFPGFRVISNLLISSTKGRTMFFRERRSTRPWT
jgi:hypothetical protein